MKNKKISIIVMLGLLMMSGQIWVMHAASSSAQDSALAFIEDVLPIDSTQWNIELKVDGNTTDIDTRTDLIMQNNNVTTKDGDKILRYGLASMVGTADYLNIIFIIRENNFFQGIMDIDNAPTYNTYGRPLETANITNYLANYQSWSGLDSTKMIETLSNVDLTQNSSISLGNLTMSMNRMDDSTKIRWVFPDLRKFDVSFQNYFLTSFYDERQIPSIVPTQTPTTTQFPTINAGAEPPNPEPLSTMLVTAVTLVVVLAVVAGLLVYHKKHKHNLVKEV
jgi:hypothetical protein